MRDLPEEALQSAVRRCNYCVTKADNVRRLPCFISQAMASRPLRVIAHDVRSFHPGQVRKAAISVAAAGVPSSYEALVGLPRA